ncbi:hypothetical protein ACFY04_41005 [Streptomyces sp. NPDC001549]|uniref:hypothetical protein n=1 Tax=Streptomyces sp. NPDC001549 TaxID=3364586 RepID=UPI00369889AB
MERYRLHFAHPWTRAASVAEALSLCAVLGVIIYAIVRWSANGESWLGEGSPSDRIREVIWFALVCGLASMATVEALKQLTGIRGWYQRSQVANWMMRRHRRAPWPRSLHPGMEFIDRQAFDLPIEQLAAQISAAADSAWAIRRHGQIEFLEALAGDLDGIDETYRPAEAQDGPFSPREVQAAERVQRGVDQLQISVGHSWRRFVRASALWVSGAYGIALAGALSIGGIGVHILAAVLIGGVFAWILHDIAAVIERWRR